MHRSEPFLKMSLLILLFLGLAEACTPREVATKEKTSQVAGIIGLVSRLSLDGLRHNITSLKMPPLVSPQDRTEEEIAEITGLLSLQVLHEETSGCKEEVFPSNRSYGEKSEPTEISHCKCLIVCLVNSTCPSEKSSSVLKIHLSNALVEEPTAILQIPLGRMLKEMNGVEWFLRLSSTIH
ncbi:epididymal protein 13 [Symphalangus syndactylus]|uniref:epididymal protein 13 n=1 Tax=Symphalangus syndactylus TaxID=9590 RepID=UPI00244248AD|nr:epididymal protein 13 [Symphalangus syndactylus]